MKTHAKGTFLAVVILSLVTNSRAGQLDGTVCKVRVVPAEAAAAKGEKEFDDKLTFTNGIFSSKVFLARGFKPTEYEGEAEPDQAEFAAQQVNEAKDALEWKGMIRDKRVEGTLTWTKKKDGTTLSFSLTGTKH
jgi:hypothetical protein